MKIKGHSIIELKNVKTGEVERHEDDNMVTNALSLFLKDLGFLSISPITNNDTLRNNPISQLMGGLLLFDDNITEDVNTVICPGGLKMVGNGAYGVSANGEDGVTELGSWNANESGWGSDGSYRMVWDYSTTQANGIINCACLTSANHGYIGEGNNTSKASRSTKRSDYSFGGTPQAYNVDENETSIDRILKVSYADSTVTFVSNYNYNYNALYADQHMSQTGKLKVITSKIPLSKFDLRESYPMGNTEGQSYIPYTETEISLPSAFITQLRDNTPWLTPWLGGKHGNYYYMLAKTIDRLTVGSVVQGVKIDLTTLTATGFTFTNTLDETIVMNPSINGAVMFGNGLVGVACQYGATMATLKTGFMFQNTANNADTTFIETNALNNGSWAKSHIREESCIYSGHKIDFTDRTVTPVNGADAVTLGTNLVVDNPLLEDYIPYDNGYWRPSTFRLYHTTDYLATINNLQEPVTKTAEKTMKVTYIIRFDDGE